MTRTTDEDGERRLDALLAQGRLGGPARDRILEAALARSRAEARPGWRRLLAWGLPISAAAAALLFVIVRPSGFRARGGDAGVVVEVGCRDGTLVACPSGSTLLFRASGAAQGGFLAAYADPEGGGERIWYFPTEQGDSPALVARAEAQTLARGIRLGAEQPPGRYRVHLVLSRRALDRAEATAPPRESLLTQADVMLTVGP